MEVNVPMFPGERPEQRIYMIKNLPNLNVPFPCTTDWDNPLPSERRPANKPRSARLIASVEWAWSPAHSRIDAYHLSTNHHRSHWLLWKSYWDDNCIEWHWISELWCHGPKRGVPAKVAAAYLLAHGWRTEKEDQLLDPYHWINQKGLLSVADLNAIVKEVWPEVERQVSKKRSSKWRL